MDSLPGEERVEVCFAGRSNVGKSSLLNALLGRRARGLARTSAKPGHTRQLNFYDLDGKVWLVDLPGYGYAKASKTEARAWQRLTNAYLAERRGLGRAYVLIDARRGIGTADHQFMDKLDAAGVSHRCVLTKIDKLAPGDQGTILESVAPGLSQHPAAHPHPLATSVRAKEGLEELRADIAVLAGLA